MKCFDKAAIIGVQVNEAAFRKAQALSYLGDDEGAKANLKYAVSLGYSNASEMEAFLGESGLVEAANAKALIEACSKAAKLKKKKGTAKKKKGEWKPSDDNRKVAGT